MKLWTPSLLGYLELVEEKRHEFYFYIFLLEITTIGCPVSSDFRIVGWFLGIMVLCWQRLLQ